MYSFVCRFVSWCVCHHPQTFQAQGGISLFSVFLFLWGTPYGFLYLKNQQKKCRLLSWAPKSRSLLIIFTCMLPGAIKGQKTEDTDLAGRPWWECAMFLSSWVTQTLQPGTIPDAGGKEPLGLAHPSINAMDLNICTAVFMAITVWCSSPEERQERDSEVDLGSSRAPSSVDPQGPWIHTLRCAVGMNHVTLSTLL